MKKNLTITQKLVSLPLFGISFLAALMLLAGCQTQNGYNHVPAPETPAATESITLREGDILKIAFPGAPNLDTVQAIRRDGKITLSMVGEITAVGKTPTELEKDLKERYSSQLVSSEVTVTVQSASFPVFVTGAVVRPGKLMSDHPMTVLEAIMESGGFDYARANLKAVRVIRNQDQKVDTYKLNMKNAMNGTKSEPFYLKPSDIIYVPEKFSWF